MIMLVCLVNFKTQVQTDGKVQMNKKVAGTSSDYLKAVLWNVESACFPQDGVKANVEVLLGHPLQNHHLAARLESRFIKVVLCKKKRKQFKTIINLKKTIKCD